MDWGARGLTKEIRERHAGRRVALQCQVSSAERSGSGEAAPAQAVMTTEVIRISTPDRQTPRRKLSPYKERICGGYFRQRLMMSGIVPNNIGRYPGVVPIRNREA